MATLTRLLSYEEWLQMSPAEDGTDEVVNGELRFMPPPHQPHAEIVQRLVRRFSLQVTEEQVAILGSFFGLVINREPLTCRAPDLALYWRNAMIVQDGVHCSPPDLIVEIISPSETKRRKEEKLADYARISVPETWIVSPEARAVEIRLLKDSKLEIEKIVAEGSIEPTRFPGVSIPVSEIWPPDLP